jgi:hypothetical protein
MCRDDGIVCPWFFSLEARGSLFAGSGVRSIGTLSPIRADNARSSFPIIFHATVPRAGLANLRDICMMPAQCFASSPGASTITMPRA